MTAAGATRWRNFDVFDIALESRGRHHDADADGTIRPFRAEALRIAGERAPRERTLDVFDPYTGTRVGTVPMASVDDVRAAFE